MADHAHPHPGTDRAANRRALRIAFGLTATFTVVEIAGALITGSLALLADAVHMLSDNVSLLLALIAVGLAARPPTPQRSFGWQRAEILAALANGVALIAVSAWILWEAANRFANPEEVAGAGMLAVAIAGLVVNIAAFRVLHPGASGNLNMQGAMRHVLADLLGSIGVIVAAVIILTTGWEEADPIIGALIAILIAASAVPLIRDSLRILLEAAPSGVDVDEIGTAMASHEGIVEVHDLHVWTITSGFPALSAHITVGADEDCHERRRELEALLHDRFELQHTTLQVDHERPPQLLQVGGVDEAQAPGPGS